MNYQPNLFDLGNTQCACCGAVVPLTKVIPVTYMFNLYRTLTDHVCSELCKQNWHIDQMRRAGL